ncbi:MAG: hypothetical protein OXC83_05145 [Chloroflexi bacterium]|nr:hypothetical protein [Chloroflexota bacterium]
MSALLDVNVLIASAWPNHVHHASARAWFEDRQDDGWATCPLTEAGFVRVSCNPSVVRHSVTVLDAIAVLDRLTRLGNHEFWPLEQSIVNLPEPLGTRVQGYRQVTDAVLLGVAMHRDGQLATFDGGIARLVSEGERAYVCVVPV